MRSLFIVYIIACITNIQAQYNQQNLKIDQQVAVKDYRFENLQLYPVRANKAFEVFNKGVSNYLSLEDALQAKKVVISERGQSGEVNTLYIENVSMDTVMVLSGEVVQGGKQDRVIAQDLFFIPGAGRRTCRCFVWNMADGSQRETACRSTSISLSPPMKCEKQQLFIKASRTCGTKWQRRLQRIKLALQRVHLLHFRDQDLLVLS